MSHLDDLVARQQALVEAQPTDQNHERLTREVVAQWGSRTSGVVVDVGCGQGLARPFWLNMGYTWIGVTIGPDYQKLAAQALPTVHCADMHAVSQVVPKADLVYARHVLEHSPFPALALADWRDIAPLLIVVVPTPTDEALAHRGHLSVLAEYNWIRLFRFVGLKVADRALVSYRNPNPWLQSGAEYRFLLEIER